MSSELPELADQIELADETLATTRRVRARAEQLCAEVATLLHTYRSHRFRAISGASDAPDEILAGLRILVVDDHADTRDLFQEAFAFLGAKVIATKSAEDALQSLAHADVVVTDFALPGKGGAWLLAQVNASARPIPVVLVSGYSTAAVAEAPFALKLLKPVDPWDLARAIRSSVVTASVARN